MPIPSSFLEVEQNYQFNPLSAQLCDLRLSVPTEADDYEAGDYRAGKSPFHIYFLMLYLLTKRCL